MKPGIKLDGPIGDLIEVATLIPERRRRIREAPSEPITGDPVNDLARRLHPDMLDLVIDKIRDETRAIKTFRLRPDPGPAASGLPFFRAGQYLSFKVDVGGTPVTRPYSISSSPKDALEEGYVEITVRKKDGGFVTEHMWKNWKKGTRVKCSGPHGFFYHDDLRDTNEIVGLAGGCGFTPFRSMIRDIIQNDLDIKMTLLFGITKPGDAIFKKELQEIEKKYPGRLGVHYVCSEPTKAWKGRTGFLTRKLIRDLAGPAKGKTFFICGPPAMYEFLEKELKPLRIPRRRIRREVFGDIPDITTYSGFPKRLKEKSFTATVHIGSETHVIPAAASETVLVAMERAKLAPPSQCRSGECGFCDSILMTGDVFVSPENDGRRLASLEYNHFHPCASYPVTDIEITVMKNPAG